MVRDNWSHGRRSLAALVALLILVAAVAGPAMAIPRMVYRGADVAETDVLVGENVTIEATVENIGDSGGGYDLVYRRNGTRFQERRVVVPSETRRTFNETVQFDSPGTYRLSVNGDRAGIVRVRRGVATVDNETDSQRRLDVRARSVPDGESASVAIPPAVNRSFALDGWTVRTTAADFEQVLTEYTNRSTADVELPARNRSSIVGVVTVESDAAVETATMRVAVDDASLTEADLDAEDVIVYQRDGEEWEPLETSVAAAENGTTVFEATATTGTAYAVGRIDADISVESTTLRTQSTDSGQRLIVEGVLRNRGGVDGDYEATLRVDGETVSSETVTVPAAGERNVTLSTEVTESGSYSVALGDTGAGSVVITDSQVATGGDGSNAGGGDGGSGGLLPDALPASVFGVDTIYVGGAAAVVLGLLLGVFILTRGGDGGRGGNQGGFEL